MKSAHMNVKLIMKTPLKYLSEEMFRQMYKDIKY